MSALNSSHSAISGRSIFEPLESRQLLSASVAVTSLNDVLGLERTTTLTPAASLVAQPTLDAKTSLVKLKGNYNGTFTSKQYFGDFIVTLTFKTYKSNGTFSGTAIFHAFDTDTRANFSGKINSSRKVTAKFSGSGFSGSLSGKANTTGRTVKGSYTITGAFDDTGTFVATK